MSRLVVSTEFEHLITLEQDGAGLHVVEAADFMVTAGQRWQSGLDEWVPDPDEEGCAMPRDTPPDDPKFLPRLKAYIERQFPHIRCELDA